MHTLESNLTTWKDIKEFLDQFSTQWIFRGQQNKDWDLKSGIDRVPLGIYEHGSLTIKAQIEQLMIDKLNRHIHNMPSQYSSMLASNIQKIAFLQHYGAPTRLLDFTISPFVALFFAIENAVEDCALFAINYIELIVRNKILLGINNSDSRLNEYVAIGNLSSPKQFDDVVLQMPQYQFVDAVQPYYKFDRLINQSGMFLCQGDINKFFEENLQKTLSIKLSKAKPFYKIIIPIKLREEILSYLINKMNISRSTLFPGIDGFVQSLSLDVMTDLNDRVSFLTNRPPQV